MFGHLGHLLIYLLVRKRVQNIILQGMTRYCTNSKKFNQLTIKQIHL